MILTCFLLLFAFPTLSLVKAYREEEVSGSPRLNSFAPPFPSSEKNGFQSFNPLYRIPPYFCLGAEAFFFLSRLIKYNFLGPMFAHPAAVRLASPLSVGVFFLFDPPQPFCPLLFSFPGSAACGCSPF